MKKSLRWFLFGALLAAGSLAMSAGAQSNVVYAVEYNQSTNRFGTIDLLNGNFAKISSIGTTMINDIAYCPTNGTLYGISNTTALVAFNKTNGTITRVAAFSVKGIQSLAFRYSDGALFGATHTNLYRINLATGGATNVGNFGSPTNLNKQGQNIRFAQDGNLYISNTSTNTDIYRINTTNGAATWMGEAVGFPYLMLQNASSNMYGVFINLGSGASNATPELVTFDLSSFVVGGTNANGSTHQITVTMVGAGTNFPPNFNFSGNIPQAVTNLTVPVSASGPSNQTAVVGSNVVFSTIASGTGPYNYAWSKNGAAISGQTNSSLTLANVSASDAATYSVIVGGAMGKVTNSATLTVNKAGATITLGGLNQTYDGTAKAATATTIPGGLAVTFTYNGSATVPTSAGSYTVIGTINDANYQGSATNTLVINPAALTVTADNKSKISGMPNPPLTASYNGFISGENTNVLSSPAVLSTTATNTSGAGKYPITASGAAAANYAIQYVDGTLQVISAPQVAGASVSMNGTEQFVVSWPTIAGQTYQLEYTTDLAAARWTPLGTPFAGTDGIVAVTNSMSVTPQCFFRVEVQEGQ